MRPISRQQQKEGRWTWVMAAALLIVAVLFASEAVSSPVSGPVVRQAGTFVVEADQSNQINAWNVSYSLAGGSRVPGSGVIRGRGSGERETTASSLAGKEESSRKEDNSGQGKDGPAGAIAQGGNGR